VSAVRVRALSPADLDAVWTTARPCAAHPLVTPDAVRWCYAHLPAAREPLPVAVASERGTWLLPLRVEPDGDGGSVVRFYGHGLLDVMDAFALEGAPGLDRAVWPALLDLLTARLRRPVVDLAGLGPHSSTVGALTHGAGSPGVRLLVSDHQSCLRAASTAPAGTGARAPRYGRTLRKHLRRAARAGLRLVVPTGRADRLASRDALLRYHEGRWGRAVGESELRVLRDFIGASAERGDVVLPTLVAPDGAIAAVLLVFDGGGWHYLYAQGYSCRFAAVSPSRCAIALYLDRLAALGGTGLDFLRGDEAYKREFCDEAYPLLRVTGWASDRLDAVGRAVHRSFV
jgi:CelD/BcsL family acetyltransferase involved in cellulose biosynthesis